MGLNHWTFLYAADGITAAGELREVATGSSTTVLIGFPTADAAIAASASGPVARALDGTQLIELCGAFDQRHVDALRAARPQIPVGRVTYTDEMTPQLDAIFG